MYRKELCLGLMTRTVLNSREEKSRIDTYTREGVSTYNLRGKTKKRGVNPMTIYQEYTLRDGTKKSIKVVEGRSYKEEMKLLGITERDIFSMQLLDKKSLQKPK